MFSTDQGGRLIRSLDGARQGRLGKRSSLPHRTRRLRLGRTQPFHRDVQGGLSRQDEIRGHVPSSATVPNDIVSMVGDSGHRLLQEVAMNTIANVISRADLKAQTTDGSFLRTIGIFCGIGLVAFFCTATYGLDLSAGFF